MDERSWLAEGFEANRRHLHAVAYRMLGSATDADDAVQEAWLRLDRAGSTTNIDNLGGWLTTVVARVCLDMLRHRRSHRAEPIEDNPEVADQPSGHDPEQQALLADSVGLALLVVLDTLDPAERLAFVLHDMFAVSFDEIAPIVDRTPTAARKLASRARRRIQGANPVPRPDLARQRAVVAAFLAAARGGHLDALVAVLDPDVVARTDASGVASVVRGADAVAGGAMMFAPFAQTVQLVLVNGSVGIVAAHGQHRYRAMEFTIVADRIVEINVVTDPVRLGELSLATLPD